MADEIAAIAGLSFTKGGKSASLASVRQLIDMAGGDYVHRNQTIGTSEEALSLGDIGTPGWCAFKNHDATNFVSLRAGSGLASMIKVKAGELVVFRLASSTPYAIADTAGCDCEYLIVED